MDKTISTLVLLAAASGLTAFSAPASATAGSSTGCDPSAATEDMWECLEAETAPGSGTYDDITDTGEHGPFTFKGVAELSHWAVGTLECLLTAEGYVEMDETAQTTQDPSDDDHDNTYAGSNEVNIRVTSLTSSSTLDPDCSNVTFRGLDLMAYDKDNGNEGIQDDDDVHDPHTGSTTGNLGNGSNELEVWHSSWFNAICTDSVELEFGNDVNHTHKNGPSYFKFNDTLSGWLGNCSVKGTLTTEGSGLNEQWEYRDVNAW